MSEKLSKLKEARLWISQVAIPIVGIVWLYANNNPESSAKISHKLGKLIGKVL